MIYRRIKHGLFPSLHISENHGTFENKSLLANYHHAIASGHKQIQTGHVYHSICR